MSQVCELIFTDPNFPGVRHLLFGTKFAENCMNMKESGPRTDLCNPHSGLTVVTAPLLDLRISFVNQEKENTMFSFLSQIFE